MNAVGSVRATTVQKDNPVRAGMLTVVATNACYCDCRRRVAPVGDHPAADNRIDGSIPGPVTRHGRPPAPCIAAARYSIEEQPEETSWTGRQAPATRASTR